MKRSERIKKHSQMGYGGPCREDMEGISQYQERAMASMSDKENSDLEIERCKWLDEEVNDE